MPSRRRQKRQKKKQLGHLGTLSKILLPLFLLLVGFVFIRLNTKYWNGHDKFTYVDRGSDGSARVIILDPKLDEETVMTIPGETQVEVARNYGTLRLKNVWQLGTNEKLGGKLVAETITQNFLFPVFLWRDDQTRKANIPLGDGLLAKIFLWGLPNSDRSEIDLGKSQFLTQKTLNDGARGYELVGPMSETLLSYFSDNQMATGNIKVSIVDATGNVTKAQKVGKIVEVLGAKVVAVNKKQEDDSLDCLISAEDKQIAKKFNYLFGCKNGKVKGDFDVEIEIGGKFAKRF